MVQWSSDELSSEINALNSEGVTADLRLTEPPRIECDSLSQDPTVREIERQVRWEVAAVELAIKRYREEQARPDLAAADKSAGQAVIRAAMAELVPFLVDIQNTLTESAPSGPNEWWTYVTLIDAEKLAYLTLRAVVGERPDDGVPGARKLSACARAFALSVEQEVAYQRWVADDRAAAKDARHRGVPYQRQLDALKRRVKKIDARGWKRWMARLERAYRREWPEAQRFLFGAACIKWACEHGGDLFKIVLVPRRGKTELFVTMTERGQHLMEDHTARAEVSKRIDRPMLCRPKPWQWQETTYNGGYYLANRALLRNGVNGHTADLTRPISDETLRGLNTIQEVPPGGSIPRSWRRCGPPGLTDFRSPTCPAPTTSRPCPHP
jgi:DNA-directed RNA polymerase